MFNQGRIEQVGSGHELYEHPATRFVAGFIGHSNFLPVRLERRRGDVADVVLPDGRRLEGAPLRCDAANGADAALMLIEAAFAQHDHASVLSETTRSYEVMFAAGRESVAWSVVQSLNARINRLRAITITITITSRERSSSGPAEMRRLLDAIRERQPEAAQQAAETHVRQAAALALQALQQEQPRAG